MGLGSRISYRGWQFWKIIVARPLSQENLTIVKTVLNDEQLQLFLRQSFAGQQHGYRVMERLSGEGYSENDMLVAALLHDVGKIHMKSRWYDRPLVVLAQAIFRTRVEEWGDGDGSGWRRPFVIKMRHPEWGAAYAEAVFCTPLTVKLIRHHQDPPGGDMGNREVELLPLLQWADDRS